MVSQYFYYKITPPAGDHSISHLSAWMVHPALCPRSNKQTNISPPGPPWLDSLLETENVLVLYWGFFVWFSSF